MRGIPRPTPVGKGAIMQIEVVFRNLTPADSLKNYAIKRFQKISRMVGEDSDAMLQITLSKESNFFRADALLNGTGQGFSASEKNDDMYAAIDLCNDRLGQQIRKAADKRSQIDRSTIGDAFAN